MGLGLVRRDGRRTHGRDAPKTHSLERQGARDTVAEQVSRFLPRRDCIARGGPKHPVRRDPDQRLNAPDEVAGVAEPDDHAEAFAGQAIHASSWAGAFPSAQNSAASLRE